MEVCPRCKMRTLRKENVLNALSRRDNTTYICSKCGEAEAMFDFAVARVIEYIAAEEYAKPRKKMMLNLSFSMADENAWMEKPRLASNFMPDVERRINDVYLRR